MRICAKFSKDVPLNYISHLDIQRLMQRAMRRAKLPLAFSQGFNPHPVLSFASALSLGYTSAGEWMDVKLTSHVNITKFIENMNEFLPVGIKVLSAVEVNDDFPALTKLLEYASYNITLFCNTFIEQDTVSKYINELLSGEINVLKRTKNGEKLTDIRPMIVEMKIIDADQHNTSYNLFIKGVLNAHGGLNIELLMKEFIGSFKIDANYEVQRREMHFSCEIGA